MPATARTADRPPNPPINPPNPPMDPPISYRPADRPAIDRLLTKRDRFVTARGTARGTKTPQKGTWVNVRYNFEITRLREHLTSIPDRSVPADAAFHIPAAEALCLVVWQENASVGVHVTSVSHEIVHVFHIGDPTATEIRIVALHAGTDLGVGSSIEKRIEIQIS